MADVRLSNDVIDDFNRTEDPLSLGGNWVFTDAVWVDSLRADGTKATESTTNSFGSCTWTPDAWDGDDAEAWGYASGGNAPGLFWDISLVTGYGGSNAVDGYAYQRIVTTGGTTNRLYKITNGSYSTLTDDVGASGGPTWMLIRRNGNDVECWESLDISTEPAPDFSLVLTYTDTSYTTGLHAAIGVSDNSHTYINGWDFFGGGPHVVRPVPQFIRRPWRYKGRHLTPTGG